MLQRTKDEAPEWVRDRLADQVFWLGLGVWVLGHGWGVTRVVGWCMQAPVHGGLALADFSKSVEVGASLANG